MAMDENLRLRYLKAMGIQVWLPRSQAEDRGIEESGPSEHSDSACLKAQRPRVERAGPRPGDPPKPGVETWAEFERRVAQCTACELHRTRTQTVFGIGSHTANWMVIGEAPGASEDEQGKPFVGRAGQLLTEMLRAVGLSREEVFIANILKCRPPNNRDPNPLEVEACDSFLKQQLAMVKPGIILAVGRIAAQNLLKSDAPIGRLRGRVHRYRDIPLIVVYHPAYLLRSPLEKRKAWEDLQLALQTVKGLQP